MKNFGLLVVVVFICFLFTTASAQDSAKQKAATMKIEPQPTPRPKNKCSVSITGETGFYPQYIDYESAERYYSKSVAQNTTTFMWCPEERFSYGVETFNSLSMTENPSDGTEFDVRVFGDYKPNKKHRLSGEFAKYWFPQGFAIIHYSGQYARSFENEKQKLGLELSQKLSVNTTNDSTVSTGIMAISAAAIAKEWDKFTLTITPALGIDNNPYSSGPRGKIVGIGHVTARIDYKIHPKITPFVIFDMMSPLWGQTDRRFRKNFGLGFAYTLR